MTGARGSSPITLAEMILLGRREELTEILQRGDQSLTDHQKKTINHCVFDDNGVGRTALHLAVRRGWQDIIELLLKQGAQPRETDTAGDSALHEAIYCHNEKAANVFLRGGLSVDMPNTLNGETPLQLALRIKSPSAVKYLVAQGARITGTDNENNTLDRAARATPDLALFILHKIRHQEKSADEQNAQAKMLFFALAAGREDIVQALLDYGVSPNIAGEPAPLPLEYVASSIHDAEECLKFVKMLHAAGADLSPRQSLTQAPILSIVEKGAAPEVFFYLLAAGADPFVKNWRGDTLLHLAAPHYEEKILIRLIGEGLDVNAQNRAGQTPLHIAAHKNRPDNVDLLLQGGADPCIRDAAYRLPEDLCQAPYQRVVRQKIVQARFLAEETRQQNFKKPPLQKGRYRP